MSAINMTLRPKQRVDLARRLDERHRLLLAEVRDHLEHSEDRQYANVIGQLPGDVADQSVADMFAELNVTIVDRHIEALRDVEAAKARMREGTYGICIDCEDDIGFERLAAYPTATRCIRCQQLRERIYAGPSTPTL